MPIDIHMHTYTYTCAYIYIFNQPASLESLDCYIMFLEKKDFKFIFTRSLFNLLTSSWFSKLSFNTVLKHCHHTWVLLPCKVCWLSSATPHDGINLQNLLWFKCSFCFPCSEKSTCMWKSIERVQEEVLVLKQHCLTRPLCKPKSL